MHVYDSVLEMIGQTPMLRLKGYDTGPCELLLKLENTNPGGSIKDRIGLTMIRAAESRGDIKPGDTLIVAVGGVGCLCEPAIAAQRALIAPVGGGFK